MTLQVHINVDKAARALGAVTKAEIKHFRKSIQGAGTLVASEMKRRGDNDILRGGAFSTRWTNDFETPVTFRAEEARIKAQFATIEYGHIHEFGGTIRGKPLLWIPLSFGDAPKLPSHMGSGRVRARDYPGQLFRVERPGKNPLLFSDTGPQYVGVTHVTLRPRFHIREITANVVRTQLARFFYQVWKARQAANG